MGLIIGNKKFGFFCGEFGLVWSGVVVIGWLGVVRC